MINICFWDIDFESIFESSYDTVLSIILSQNHPNFNVSKTVVFENKVKGPILLKIIDSIGKNGQMIVFLQKNDARP